MSGHIMQLNEVTSLPVATRDLFANSAVNSSKFKKNLFILKSFYTRHFGYWLEVSREMSKKYSHLDFDE